MTPVSSFEFKVRIPILRSPQNSCNLQRPRKLEIRNLKLETIWPLRESRRSCHRPSAETVRAVARLDNESRLQHRLRRPNAQPCPGRVSSHRINLRLFDRHRTTSATASRDVP